MMRRALLVLAIVIVCSGQMCGVVDPMASPNRLEANDHLRAACAGFATDAAIEGFLTEVEANRLLGFTYAQQIQAMGNVCLNPQYSLDLQLACYTCESAVVNQIYGQ